MSSIGVVFKMDTGGGLDFKNGRVQSGVDLGNNITDPSLTVIEANLATGKVKSDLSLNVANLLGPMEDSANRNFLPNDDAISMFKHQSREEYWKANPVKGSTDRLQRSFRDSFSYFDKIEQ